MYSQMDEVSKLMPILWINPSRKDTSSALSKLELNERDMEEAERRWRKFAPLIEKLFPETRDTGGIIESKLVNIPEMKSSMEGIYGIPIEGSLYLKCDSHLPVAGSIKARGGIYEVLKHGEELALKNGMISEDDDYSLMASDEFKEFFSRYSLAVGSTGNLGLSIGIMGSALGFKVTVHMSADAKEWKKDILRRRGVEVIEYASDYSKAVEEGRRKSLENPMSYFVDDENSKTLFLGYSAAAYRLKRQLDEEGITVDSNHPLFVYLPCGVGGAPGGICFGLKNLLGDNVHCFFGEPTHSPCMLLGLMTGKHDKVSVRDFGLDNITDADGLAVGRQSGFVGRVIGELISGIYTVEDSELYRLLSSLIDSEGVKIEPSAAASLLGPVELYRTIQGRDYIKKENLEGKMKDSTHIAWATGGLFVPEELMKQFYEKGKALG